MTIQQLNNSHSQQIVNLILPIQQIEFNVPITLEKQQDLLDIEKHYIGPGGNFWGVIHDNEVVGTIALIATGHNAGAIRKMFVKKEFRGKELGIAQQLLDELLRYCQQNNITDLYLGTVEILKAAHRFYERNGFQKISKEDLPDYFPFMQPDTIFYHLHMQA
ncbi:N-acetylglutamate synthase, GNAT family [Filimonas lacunae]|uniref:N-acetylglutamate synthase, GNAT family n=1 Tax=Filimonas lacunae TaxID=477680 RepID=A0A173MCC4_9BACT|nr:GNAT family N-acetyltransferase [Filimonas lacunae]BAV05111.1 GCN5-related N-acetyltransferase [Filimonas lacunae]SIT34215.1 N-acetylglutamate synthase, GNAT family [Filimonas lacunae]